MSGGVGGDVDVTGDGAGGGLAFTLGHGTENDFVLLTDPDGRRPLGPRLAARLADRRAGLGADGVIRAVRSAALPEGAGALAEDAGAEWFMDHRNADGSLAEMCGNGVRVLVAHLLDAGLVAPGALDAPGGLALGTRAGVRRVRRALGPAGQPWFAVDAGVAAVAPGAAAAGADHRVAVAGLDGVVRPGLGVDVGNPHVVVALASAQELAAADLSSPPAVDPLPLEGANVELVVVEEAPEGAAGDEHVGRLAMRVHERGAGETRSCGTGACAAVAAVRSWAGAGAPRRWWVDVPGGVLGVRALEGGRTELSGPAVLVARGTVTAGWLAAG